MVSRQRLVDGWTLDLLDRPRSDVPPSVRDALPVTARVPGTVHTDLLAAGLVDDPYLDRNELRLDWIGRQDWVYRRTLAYERVPGRRTTLLFDGLDTVATVVVNGSVVLEARNMHRRYAARLDDHLLAGENTVEVRFGSALTYAERERDRLGARPSGYPAPIGFVRKMACNFGWDWGPTVVTAGIWRDASLVQDAGVRIAEVRPHTSLEGRVGRLRLEVLLDGDPRPGDLVHVTLGDRQADVQVPAGATQVVADMVVEEPELWWPHDLGTQPLYDLCVTYRDDGGQDQDSWKSQVAFRSVRLDTTPDADGEGSGFALVVNDVAVPVRGSNWIPDDCFLPRVDETRLRRRIGQAVEQNSNLLRVWGGGVYESEEFYRSCDELGVLVWQDFLFACAAYPEEEPLRSEVLAEAEDNVARLLPHPSLVLWNGNNENIWGWFDWAWADSLGELTWGLGYYLHDLPEVVLRVDPDRPYWPGSPYSGSMDRHPNDERFGATHVWDVWNARDWTAYRDYRPRFVSEFGWQAPPTWSTLLRSVHDSPLTPQSPGMLHHQKAEDGLGKLERGLAPHLPVPDHDPGSLADWHYVTQLNQARAVACGITWWRAHRPRTMGTVVWQLNDCWPVTSWAAIDGDGRRKPLWYAQRSAQATRLLTLQPLPDGLSVVAVNDGPQSWREQVVVRRVAFDGTELARHELRLPVDRFGAAHQVLPAPVATPDDPTAELVVAETGSGTRAVWTFAEDRDLRLDPDPLDVGVGRHGGDGITGAVEVRILARSAVRGLCLFPDRITPDAEVSDSVLDLVPGQEVILRVTGVPPGRENELGGAPVLRHVGELLARQATPTTRAPSLP